MNVLAKAPPPPKPEPSLESMLIALAAYGEPVLSINDWGWTAWIDMRVAAAGTNVKIRATFDGNPKGYGSPTAAVRALTERMHATLAALGSRR